MANVIETCGLTKRYGQLTAVDGVNLSVGEGELFGLIGPDGAGKSSIYRMLATLMPPDGGTARVLGLDVAADYRRIGLWAQRLLFTTENPRECVQVAQRYLEQGSWTPNEYTRGLYYRDVE